jgi:hypothetical protein
MIDASTLDSALEPPENRITIDTFAKVKSFYAAKQLRFQFL